MRWLEEEHPMNRQPRWLSATLCLALPAVLPALLPHHALAAEAVLPVAQASAVVRPLPRELGKPQDDVKLDITGFVIDGLPEASVPALAALTAAQTGPGRTYEDLINAAAAVTRHMQRDMGYYVGFAYVPEQKMLGGQVHLQALEGRLDQVRVMPVDAGQQGAQDAPALQAQAQALVDERLAHLQPGAILRTDDVERGVLLLNDVPGWRFRVEIEEGSGPGTASLRVTPFSERGLSGRAELDTLGNRYTGLARLSGTLQASNPLRRGDVLTAQALSSHTGGLKQLSASYTLPLGAQGLKLGGTVSRVEYGLDRDAYPADYAGSVVSTGLFALHPLLRSRNANVFGLISLEHKQFDDHQAGLRPSKFSNDWQLGLVGDARDDLLGGAINTFELQALHGRMGFGAGANPLGLSPSFNKVTLGASRLQGLVPGRLQLFARYKAQWAGAGLDATEKYAAGGPLGVRAFGPGEASADHAQVANAELRWLPPEPWLGPLAREVLVTTFYDWAHVRFSHDAALQPAGQANAATLSGAGLGLIWDRPGKHVLRLDVAWPITGTAWSDPRHHEPRANAVFTQRF
jgi:hemolysin activation/secretion protein